MENVDMGLWAVNVTVYQEDSKGKEKGVRHPYLVNAASAKHAIEIVEEDYKGSPQKWKISAIKKSNVVDVLNYSGVQNLTKNTQLDTSLMLND